MITNKPVMGETLSSLEVESRLTAGGDQGGKFEYMSNVPLGDRSALRFVAYKDRRGGYIDQGRPVTGAHEPSRQLRLAFRHQRDPTSDDATCLRNSHVTVVRAR